MENREGLSESASDHKTGRLTEGIGVKSRHIHMQRQPAVRTFSSPPPPCALKKHSPSQVLRRSEECHTHRNLNQRNQHPSLHHEHHHAREQVVRALDPAFLVVREEEAHAERCNNVGQCVEAFREAEEYLQVCK